MFGSNIEDIKLCIFELHLPALIEVIDLMADVEIQYEELPRGESLGFHAMVLLAMKTKPVRTYP
jgi:hypothetical protein